MDFGDGSLVEPLLVDSAMMLGRNQTEVGKKINRPLTNDVKIITRSATTSPSFLTLPLQCFHNILTAGCMGYIHTASYFGEPASVLE
ncbi:hypothetical protein KIN20_025293 [Parelaphostrongylus tenuis]|uniref:Uncharacterized protein n=1 Tax=Parelaphostrongylus tenuis TaxID=148309 RepID=A0AAD5QUB4_PARTN|nr:hypothetical protein KIN20_025293 [Parelaphostrongylus tenuis]